MEDRRWAEMGETEPGEGGGRVRRKWVDRSGGCEGGVRGEKGEA